MSRSRVNLFEILVLVMIILVIVWTVFEDVAVLTGWAANLSGALVLIGFAFDLFFTIEFLTRLYNSRSENGMFHYLIHDYGWIDFFASVPLLMLSSGPPIAAQYMTMHGALGLGMFASLFSILKLIKIIRIARVLRLLRILKLFRNIKYTDTTMGQRHVTRIITLGVSVVVISLFFTTIFSESMNLTGAHNPSVIERTNTFNYIRKHVFSTREIRKLSAHLISTEIFHDIVFVERAGKIVYSRSGDAKSRVPVPSSDHLVMTSDKLNVYFNIRQENEFSSRNQAIQNIVFFFTILFLIAGYLVLYSPHFTLTVTDPLKVMKQGMSEKEYNLEVSIPELYGTDEVYQLAKHYNQYYLPLKDRNRDLSPQSKIDLAGEALKQALDISPPDDFE